MTLDQKDLEILSKEFPTDQLGVKIQSLSKDRTKAMLVLYLSHTTVMARLEEVDPAWTTETLRTSLGETVTVEMRMTLKGVKRENAGEGNDLKAAYSDALKRCAMLFGIGRYLYDSPMVWVPYNESNDRYRAWSYADYEKIAKMKRELISDTPTPSHFPVRHPSEAQLKRLFAISKSSYWSQDEVKEYIQKNFGIESTQELTLPQYDQICAFMPTSAPQVTPSLIQKGPK